MMMKEKKAKKEKKRKRKGKKEKKNSFGFSLWLRNLVKNERGAFSREMKHSKEKMINKPQKDGRGEINIQ